LLDVDGLFRPLLAFLDHLVAEQFLRPEHREMLLVRTEPAELIAALAGHRPGYMPKWIDRQQT
jgi:predicted Rossmann-fold nucleotide-binding protein